MEITAIILFVIILILFNSIKKTIEVRFNALEDQIRQLRGGVSVTPVDAIPQPTVQPPKPVVQETATEPVIPVVPTVATPKEKPSLSRELEALLEQSAVPVQPIGQVTVEPVDERTSASTQFDQAAKQEPVFLKQHEPSPSFLERNPDLEKFIGENLISKIGIAILVLAIGFFVKYAIDNDWIGPVGRVGIGILCGGILVAVAHRLRNQYKAFSSVLVGGGLAIFYFTITLGYQQFHLFSQTAGFVIMVVITAFAVALSHLYDRQELAVIALIGGFATPFMVSNGSGNYKVLFTYLLILNGGLLAIAYNKAWRILNILAFIFTVILFAGWLINLPYASQPDTYRAGFLFATLFYLLFLVINIAHNIRERKRFIASDFGILLSNTALYFAAGLYCLSGMNADEYHGLFSAAMGVFNLALSYILLRKQSIDKNILYLLIGVTLSFISLTAPIQLNGNYITLFWSCECVLLYWLYLKSQIPIVRIASMIIWVAMLISLVWDWFNVYAFNFSHAPVIANKGFITTLFGAVGSYLLFTFRKTELNTAIVPARWPHKNVFRVTALLLLYLAGAFEINYQFSHYYPMADVGTLYLLLYTFGFILLFTTVTQRVASITLPWYLYYGFLALCIIIYLLSLNDVFDIQQRMLTEQLYKGHFMAHWLAAILMSLIFFTIIRSLRFTANAFLQKNVPVLTWLLCTAMVIYASAEVHLLANQLYYSRTNSLAYIQSVYVKAGLPILWGICSFAFMYTGMRFKFRTLRIISLSLFSLTLLKLFIYDIRNIPVTGKIAAFFILGILLLIVSFMYQRLKTIIIENEKKSPV